MKHKLDGGYGSHALMIYHRLWNNYYSQFDYHLHQLITRDLDQNGIQHPRLKFILEDDLDPTSSLVEIITMTWRQG